MTGKDARRTLVQFLDEHAFDPVLHAAPERYPEQQRDELENVQRATRSEQDRFHEYSTAEEVYRMFKDDLSSDAARKVHAQLQDLELPTIRDIRRDFENLADQLGVRS